MDVSILRCGERDIDDVIGFIRERWKRDHILAADRELLDWQYRATHGDGYSFIVARRNHDGAVLGILGYISTSRYDPALANDNVIWLTTWRVREDAAPAGLGIRLLQRLDSVEPPVAIGAVGLTPSTIPI